MTSGTSTANNTKIAGPINVYGGNISVSTKLENTVTTAGSNNILLKATGNVLINSAYTVKTANGDIVFWSNADGLVDGNVIGSTGAITTGGGNFVAAGGAIVDSNGYPNGYAKATDASGLYGVRIQGDITTSGGKVTLIGEGPGGAVNTITGGIELESGTNISTGAGDVSITGRTAATNTYGSNTYGIWSGNTTTVSITTTTGNVTLYGDATNNGAHNYRRGILLYPLIVTTGAGNISITGKANNTTGSYDVWSINTTNDSSLTSTSGDITVTGSGNAATEFQATTISTAGTTTITANNLTWDSSASYLNGTGAVVVEPVGTDWLPQSNTSNTTAALDMSSVTVASGKPSFRIGKYNSATSHSTKTVTAPSMSVAGPISIYGGDVALGASTVVTGATDNLLVKATGSITEAATPTITTKAGDLTLWADSDANKAGAITLGTVAPTSATVTTVGGELTLAGGLDDGASSVESGRTAGDNRPDGWSYSETASGTTSGGVNAITVYGNSTISTSGGNVFFAGQAFESRTAAGMGLRLYGGTQIAAGAGTVHIYGKAVTPTVAFVYGALISGGSALRPMTITTTGTQSNSIVLSGVVTGTAARSSGISFTTGTSHSPAGNIVANSSSGGITIYGSSPSGGAADTTDIVGDGIEIGKAAFLSKSGTITLNGQTTAATSNIAAGMGFAHNATYSAGQASFGAALAAYTLNSVDMTTSSADIKLNADSYAVTTAPSIKTTGKVSFSTPSGYASNSFDKAVTMSKFSIDSGVTGITVGNPGTSGTDQNTANVTMDTAYSIAGPISVYGGDISISGSQVSSLLNAGVLFKATGKITTTAGTSAAAPFILRTNKGDLTLWANAAGTATAGSIFVDKYNYLDTTNATGSSMATGGGDITLAGGTTTDANGLPTGYATSDTAADGAGGVALGTATTGGATTTTRPWLRTTSMGEP